MKKNMRRIIILMMMFIGLLSSAEILGVTETQTVYADTVTVTIKIIPLRGPKSWWSGAREDIPVRKARLILNGASSGNRSDMVNGDTHIFTINVPRSGTVKPLMIEAILQNNARIFKTRSVWIDGSRNQTIWVTID